MSQSLAFLLQPVSAAESGQKLLQFLTRRFAQAHGDLPPSMIHRWARTGQIRCNGKRCKAFQHVIEGDSIRLPPFALAMITPEGSPQSATARAEANTPLLPSLPDLPGHVGSPQVVQKPQTAPQPPLPLPQRVYESPNLLVFNKIAGLPVHTGTGHSDSLTTRLHAHYAGTLFSPTPAHRLDKETTGLLLVARSYTMLRFLQTALADHRMGKEYLAWVDGRWPLDAPPQEVCDKLVKQYTDAYAKVERLPTAPPVDLQPEAHAAATAATRSKPAPESTIARAIVHCVEQRGQCSLMHIRLLTGKTHQIRVQLASRGFPLCGDVKYGGTGHPPFKLHAMRLILPPLDWPEAPDQPAPNLECLPPWQGTWLVRTLPPPLPVASLPVTGASW